jgi:hypothetical protein
MAEQFAQSQPDRVTLRAPLPLVVAACIYALLLAVGNRLLNDPDSFWHLVIGRWMVEHGAVPRVDMFSFTLAGAPWIAKEWLSQLLYAGAHALGGWVAVVVLAAASTALAFGLLARFLSERVPPIPTLALTVAAALLTAPHLVARPHALALPILVAWVAGLVAAADARRAPSFALLPLMALWANLHGGFTFGLVIIAPFALEGVLVANSAERLAVAWKWLRFGVLALFAACITPYGPESILVTGRVLGLGEALSFIGEWRPQDFTRLGPFELCLLLGAGLVLWRGLTLPPIRVLVVVGLLHMALAHNRNSELFGLLVPIVIAGPLATWFGWSARQDETPSAHKTASAGAVMAIMAALTLAFAATRDMRPNASVAPVAAVAALQASKAERVLNDYDFGGYLIYSGRATFIDGRTELFGGPFMVRYLRAIMLRELDDFLRLLDEYRVDATLLSPSVPAVALLDRLPGWERIYTDDIAVVHVRRPGAAATKTPAVSIAPATR